MRKVALESLRAHSRRYVAALCAVVLGVGFVVVTNALTSSARNGVLAGLEQEYTGAEVVVTGAGVELAEQVLRVAEDEGGAASVNAVTFQPVGTQGVRISDTAAVGTVSRVPELRWQQLVEGRFPQHPGEALVDANAAKANQVGVGDELTLGEGADRLVVEVVGTVEASPGFLDASAYLTWPDLLHWRDRLLVQDVVYDTGRLGTDAAIARIHNALPEAHPVPQDAHLMALQTQANQGVDVLTTVILLFAGISLFVAVLVIANTFTILLAQRQRDFALMRCVGATRRQVVRAVRAEAAALGAVAATVGVLAGAGLGYGAVAAVRAGFASVPLGAVQLSWGWLAGAWLLGVVVTLVAAVLPTRRTTRLSPLAALRPEQAPAVGNRAGRARVTAAVLALAVGSGLMWVATDQHELLVMMAGGFVFFVGLLLLGPLLVPALIRLATTVTSRVLGVPGRLAAANAQRHPRRSAATAASLLVGVTLISAIVVGMASVRSTVDAQMAADHPVDGSLVATDALPQAMVEQVRATPGVAEAVALDGLEASVGGGVGEIVVLGSGGVEHVVRGAREVLRVEPGTIVIPHDRAQLDQGTAVTVAVGGQRLRLRVEPGTGWGDAALVAPETLRRLGDPAPRAVWVRATDDADADELVAALTAIGRGAGAAAEFGVDDRAYVDLQLDVLLGAAVGLLGISVLVALGGIGNTLGLSVLERTREIALLRAMGLTRRALRTTLAVEALLLSLVAGVLGVATGTLFAWVGMQTVVERLAADSRLVLPAGQLLAVVGVAALAGLVACVMPARRGARIQPAAGLASE